MEAARGGNISSLPTRKILQQMTYEAKLEQDNDKDTIVDLLVRSFRPCEFCGLFSASKRYLRGIIFTDR
ncbi:unnamed protein product [Allacma fusca]|nr:unnamed protein product [Allacma fusca]